MIRILVLQNRFVSVGEYSTSDDGRVVLTNAFIVRRWGTTAGLGELAEKGPLANTRLDPTPTERIPQRMIIKEIDCNEKAWAPVLKKHAFK